MSHKLKSFSSNYIDLLIKILDRVNLDDVNLLVDLIWDAQQRNKTVFFVGNGGSASTATHLAADLAKNTIKEINDPQEPRLRCLSLTDNPAWITALSNDISYNDIFIEQLKNLAQPGDLIIFITGSGNSVNLIKAALYAKKAQITTAGLLGFDGGYLQSIIEHAIVVPSNNYGIVESIQSSIHHYLVEAIKELKK